MGFPMTGRLAAAGFALKVYDLDRREGILPCTIIGMALFGRSFQARQKMAIDFSGSRRGRL
jgi:3-hydroxyisobutyrate dehydrogenase-like beta-hydroxyacid dehydrogenase